MIELELKYAVVLYSGVLFTIAVGIWLITEFSARRAFTVLEKQNLWRCTICGYAYLDEDAQQISQCPRCESYNSITDKHAKEVRPRYAGVTPEPNAPPDPAHRGTSRRKRPGQRRRGPRRRG